MNYSHLRRSVLSAAKEAFHGGLVSATAGNYSCFDPNLNVMAITPSGRGYESMTEHDIVIITLEGQLVEGIHKPSSETPMHTMIYRKRPDIRGIAHTHSPYATSFATLGREIPVILIEMVAFLEGDAQVAKYAPPSSEELGLRVLEKLQDRKATLLESHGVVAVGETLEKALMAATIVEDAAKIYHLALQVGHPKIIREDRIREMKIRWGMIGRDQTKR